MIVIDGDRLFGGKTRWRASALNYCPLRAEIQQVRRRLYSSKGRQGDGQGKDLELKANLTHLEQRKNPRWTENRNIYCAKDLTSDACKRTMINCKVIP